MLPDGPAIGHDAIHCRGRPDRVWPVLVETTLVKSRAKPKTSDKTSDKPTDNTSDKPADKPASPRKAAVARLVPSSEPNIDDDAEDRARGGVQSLGRAFSILSKE